MTDLQNEVQLLNAQLSTTKEHFHHRCDTLTTARDRALAERDEARAQLSDLETDVARLRLALRVERERRLMAALWGSRDEDCPRCFSLYRNGDGDEPGGILGYGFVWPDDATMFRWGDADGPPDTWNHFRDMWEDMEDSYDGGVQVVWLSEDIDDLTDAITEDVKDKYRKRFTSDTMRVHVAHAIRAADPSSATWKQAIKLAEAALQAMTTVDESAW